VDSLRLDVAILGGGLAGNFLARQLRRALPDLRIGLFEKATERSWKVGESSVEITGNYLVRRLALSRYLYEHHLPKNGLRYFFDGPERQTCLTRMSEVGTHGLPYHPAFQIDRARMERDLLAMNAEQGVEVRTGAKVQALELGQDGAPHRFEVLQDGHVQRAEARWVVDATGRTSLVAKQKGLRIPEEQHALGAVWGRFERVTDIDDLGNDAFRARVRYTARGLSTVHLCYPGYWIWFIPLKNGVTSVGVVGEKRLFDRGVRTDAGFCAFLESHGAAKQLLVNAKVIDVQSFTQLAYGTTRFFHADRWGLIGDAASFTDPLYSPGIDFVALENDFLCDLVRRDHAGEPADALAERTSLYDRFMRFRHEAAMRLYRGLYGTLGSFELMRMKWELDIGCYYNLWVAAYMKDMYLDERFVEQQLRWQPHLLQALGNFAELFRGLEKNLWERGAYHRCNQGRYSHGLENIDFVAELGLPRSRRTMLKKTADIFNVVRREALDVLDVEPGSPARAPLPLSEFMGRRPIV